MARRLAFMAVAAWVILLRPFPVTAFMAGCAACVSYPLYLRLLTRLSPSRALAVYTVGLMAAIALPLAVVAALVAPQAVSGLYVLDNLRDPAGLLGPEAQAWVAWADERLREIPGLEGGLNQLAGNAASLAGSAARTVLAGGVGLAGGAFHVLLELFVFVIMTLLVVSRGTVLRDFIRRLSGFPYPVIDRFTLTIRKAIFGVLMGVVFVALIQGFLCGLGFSAADVPQPAFWGLIAAFAAPIPFVGTAMVWGPACLWLWFAGSKTAAIGLAIWCTLVVTGVDNIFRPFFLKTGIDASLAALVLAILCGLVTFGPVGIFAGPVLVAVAQQAGRESSACRTEHIPDGRV